jgi:hypothetical protein
MKLPSLSRLEPPVAHKPARDPRAATVALIVNAGAFRRAETDDPPEEEPVNNDPDAVPGHPPEPQPGQLILDAIKKRERGK